MLESVEDGTVEVGRGACRAREYKLTPEEEEQQSMQKRCQDGSWGWGLGGKKIK